MQIFHLSDIHGDIASLETAIEFINKESNTCDLIAITGDFPGECDTPEFYRDLRTTEGKRISLEQLKEAEVASITRQYSSVKAALDTIKLPIMSVPGNCDWMAYETLLIGGNHQTAHKRLIEFGGARIAGFGGSHAVLTCLAKHPNYTVFEDYVQIPNDRLDRNRVASELYDLLRSLAAQPNIVLTHMPPRSFLGVPENRDIGSFGLSDYLSESSNTLVLCGHQHQNFGIERRGNGNVIINAGNLGLSMHDEKAFGTFYVIGYESGFQGADCLMIKHRKNISRMGSR